METKLVKLTGHFNITLNPDLDISSFPNADGFADIKSRQIWLNTKTDGSMLFFGVPSAQHKCYVWLHEIAHVMLHQPGDRIEQRWLNLHFNPGKLALMQQKVVSRYPPGLCRLMEWEADFVALVVGEALGPWFSKSDACAYRRDRLEAFRASLVGGNKPGKIEHDRAMCKLVRNIVKFIIRN